MDMIHKIIYTFITIMIMLLPVGTYLHIEDKKLGKPILYISLLSLIAFMAGCGIRLIIDIWS